MAARGLEIGSDAEFRRGAPSDRRDATSNFGATEMAEFRSYRTHPRLRIEDSELKIRIRSVAVARRISVDFVEMRSSKFLVTIQDTHLILMKFKFE